MLRETLTAPVTRVPDALDWSAPTNALGLGPVFDRFDADAAVRDATRRLIHDETRELKQLGFGALRLATKNRNALSLHDFFSVSRDLSKADPNIAHVFRNHFFAIETHMRTPDAPISARVLELAQHGAMFGVAFSEGNGKPAGGAGYMPMAQLIEDGDGYRISGVKVYSTGNIYADHLFSSALDPAENLRHFLLDTKADGVILEDDWDGFGQKLTGSGKTKFVDVRVEQDDLFTTPAPPPGAPFLHGYTFHQIYLTNVIAGIASRILHDAINTIRGRSRNFYHALHEHPSDEPELQAVVGRIAAYCAAIEGAATRAVTALERAWANATAPDAGELSILASITAAEAKIFVDETAATLAGLLIDVSSGSGVSQNRALDRHWRNIKVISAHNPRVYKERIVGDYYLNGTAPPTGAFF